MRGGIKMKQISFWKWLLQTLLPFVLFVTYRETQVEPFTSEHQVASFVVLVVVYFVWHIYVDLVRDGKL